MAFAKLKALSSDAGLIVSPTKGDGRGNDLHKPAGAPGGHGGEFASKEEAGSSIEENNVSKYFNRMSEVYKAPTMRNFVLHRQNATNKLRYVTAKEQENAERMRPYMQKILDGSNFTICIQFTHFLSFLKDGRYKNQFETGVSHGLKSSDVRFRASRGMFGHDLNDIELGKTLEKYGCLQSKNIKSYFDEKSGAKYGGYGASGYAGSDGLHCAMILKKSTLKDRTTYCMGDSLNTGVYPQKYTLPFDVFTCNRQSKFADFNKITELFAGNENSPCKLGGSLGSGNFIELQYHGDVTDKDVSKLIVGSRAAFNGLDSSNKLELLKGCASRGIKVLVNNGHDDGLEQANLDSDGNIYYTIYESEEIDDD